MEDTGTVTKAGQEGGLSERLTAAAAARSWLRSPHSPSVSARTAQRGDLAQATEQPTGRGRSLDCGGGALRLRGRDRRRGFRENRARGRSLAVAD